MRDARKRLNRIFLRTMGNTGVASLIVIALFGGMSCAIWSLLDSNRALERLSVIGKIVPSGDQPTGYSPSSDHGGILAELIVYDGMGLRDKIGSNDEIRILFTGLAEVPALRATVLGVNQCKPSMEGGHDVVHLSIAPEGNRMGKELERLFAVQRYRNMEILVRTEKLWRVLLY